MFKHILIATDGSPASNRASKAGIALAKGLSAKVTILSALELAAAVAYAGISMDARMISGFEKEARIAAQKRIETLAKLAAISRVPCVSVITEVSPAFKAIVAAAKKLKCDAIVLGSHGRRGFSKFILGSVTQQVLAHTTLPVLVFR